MYEYIRNLIINEDVQFEESAKLNLIDIAEVGVFKVGKDGYGMNHICNFSVEPHRACTVPVLTVPAAKSANITKLVVRAMLHRATEGQYANFALARMNKPFLYEFPANCTVADKARIISECTASSDMRLFTVKADGNNLVFTGVEGAQGLCAETAECTGENDKHEAMWSNVTEVKPVWGTRGFGSYDNLIHDLRLPTIEHFNYFSPQKHEMPIPGKNYDLYTFEYNSGLTNHGSGDLLGSRLAQFTTHKFWVATDLAETSNIKKVLNALKANTLVNGTTVANAPVIEPVEEEVED